jgi:hypothetical protein
MRVSPFAWGGWETFWVLFYALATWGNAGFLREQVCKYMCPYARFQSAMFDRNTLIIAYDPMRGEPRGPRASAAWAASRERARAPAAMPPPPTTMPSAPACIPQPPRPGRTRAAPSPLDRTEAEPLPKVPARAAGRLRRLHDLRAGLPDGHRHPQWPAVRVHRLRRVHRRLQRGDGQARLRTWPDPLHHAERHRRQARRASLRPRIIVYGTLLALLAAGWGVGRGMNRKPFIAEVLRDRNALYRVLSDGTVGKRLHAEDRQQDGSGRAVRRWRWSRLRREPASSTCRR